MARNHKKIESTMKIPFGDLSREYLALKSPIDKAFDRVLLSGQFLLGKECEKFEESFAQYCGSKYCVGVASGTEAISLALMALDIGRDDLVITVPNTAVPTASAISMVGAQPLFVDIDEKNMLMDSTSLENLLKDLIPAKLRRVKAIIPVHLFGLMCPMDKIKKITDKYKIPVIEDCAQAHGCQYKNKKAGTIGIMGCYSFYPSKNLGCYGDGGCIITNNNVLSLKLKKLRNYGQKTRYCHEIIGINSRLSEIQASALRVKLKYLNNWNKKRINIALQYIDGLKNCPITLQDFSSQIQNHVYHLMVIRTDKRDSLKNYLANNNIETLIHYPTPIYFQKAYRYLKIKKGICRVAEKVSEEILSLPLYPYIKKEELNIIIFKIKEFFNDRS